MTEYQSHLQTLIGLRNAGHPRNRHERRAKEAQMRAAARYCVRCVRRNPRSKVYEDLEQQVRSAVR